MFKINLNTFKFCRTATLIMKTKFLGEIIVEDQLYAFPVKNRTNF